MKESTDKTGKARVRGFYDVWGPIYTWLRDFGRDDHEDKSVLIEVLAPFDNDTVLDVGTGPGAYALRVADRAADCQVVGIDLSPAFIKIACRRASERQMENIEFKVGDIEDLGFADGQFSKVLCAGVLSVVGNRGVAVAEMARVLRPGGCLAVREPVRSNGPLARFFASRGQESTARSIGSGVGLMFGHFSPDFMTGPELRALFDGGLFSEVTFTEHARDLVITATK